MDKIMEFARLVSIQKGLEMVAEGYTRLIDMGNFSSFTVRIINKPKYVYVDIETSGKYLLEKPSLSVYSIKAYGVKNAFKGNIDSMIEKYRTDIANLKAYLYQRGKGDYVNKIDAVVNVVAPDNRKVSIKGQIFYRTWGYGMTLNDFFIVVDETETMCTVVKLKTLVDGDTDPSGGKATPSNVKVGKPFKLKKTVRDNDVILRGTDKSEEKFDTDSHSFYLWDGKPRYHNTWD